MRVNNVESSAYNYKYIVAREVDGELWFWGAWNELDKAMNAAKEISGVVLPSEEVKGE